MDKTRQEKAVDAGELTSALADGELRGSELARGLDALQADTGAHARWHTYHLVGDVLRSGAGAAVGGYDADFMTRLRQRLEDEKTAPSVAAPLRKLPMQRSANDGVWRWKLVAGLSSLAVVGVLGWQLLAALRPEDAGAQLARSAPAPLVATQVQLAGDPTLVMIRDPQLDQLIAAHQQQGGTSALQMPAGFLRNATYERPAR